MMTSVLVLLWATWLVGAPQLDDTAQVQLDAVHDGSARLDNAGLYALLDHALRWNADDETGARVPDYPALANHPQAWRGQIMLIEGTFLRQRHLTLAKPGPWGQTMTEWAVQVGPGDADHDFALVYFADPDQTITPPTRDTPVRIAARFYMAWRTMDMENRSRRYLTFVGGPARWERARSAFDMQTMVLMVALTAAGAGLFLLRRLIRRGTRVMPLARQQERSHAPEPLHHDTNEARAMDATLPDDPADALAQLHDDQPSGGQ